MGSFAGGELGELFYTIGGDWSALQDALAKAEGASAEAAREISDAFKALDPGELNLFNQALLQLENQGDTAAEALNSISESGAALGEHIAGAAEALRGGLVPSEHEAGEAAAEAKSQFEGFGESLAKMAELGGVLITLETITELLKDIARESINAFENLQMTKSGLTALTGSAEEATKVLEAMEDIAKRTPFSFPDLAQAAQRMALLGVSAEKIPDAMMAVAHSAELAGLPLESVAGTLDRIYNSATVQSRTLLNLGISMKELGDTMGVATDQVQATLKALGPQSAEALDALVLTMRGKSEEAGEAMEGNLKVRINALKTEWDALLISFGQDIAPHLGAFVDALAAALPYVERVLAAVATLASQQLTDVVSAFVELAAVVKDVAAPLTNLLGVSSTLAGALKEIGSSILDQLTGWRSMAVAATAISVAIQEMRGQIDGVAGAQKILAAYTGEQTKQTQDNTKATQDQKEAIAAQVSALQQRISAAMAAVSSGADLEQIDKSEAAALKALQEGYAQIASDLKTLYKPALQDVAAEQLKVDAAREAAVAANARVVSAENDLKAIYDASNHTAEQLQNRVLLLNAAKKDAENANKNLTAAEKELSEAQRLASETASAETKVQEEMDRASQKIADDFDKLIGKIDSIAAKHPFDALTEEMIKLDAQAAKNNLAYQAALETYTSMQSVGTHSAEAVNEAFRQLEATAKRAGVSTVDLAAAIQAATAGGVIPMNAALTMLGITADGLGAKASADLVLIESELRRGGTSAGELDALFGKLQGDVKAMAGDPDGMTRLISDMQTAIDKLTAMHAPAGVILSDQAVMLDAEIKLAEQQGRDATTQIVALTNVHLKQQALIDQSVLMGNVYVGLMHTFDDTFRQLGKGIADNIVDAKNWGDVFTGISKNIAKEILENLVGTAFKALEDAIIKNTGLLSTMGGIFTNILGGGGGGGLNTTGPNLPGVGGGGGGAGAAAGTASSVTGIIGAVGSIGTMISGIIGNFQNARQETTLNAIELNTRQVAMFIGGYGGGGISDWIHDTLGYIHELDLSFTGIYMSAFAHLMSTMEEIRDLLRSNVPLSANSQVATAQAIAAASPANVTANFHISNPDPRMVTQEIARYLKTLSPRFSV